MRKTQRLTHFISRQILLITAFLMVASLAFSQVTTSGINGIVIDDKGVTLPGATVLAVHVPSGSNYYTITNSEGGFQMQGLRSGGPYKVTVSYVGYSSESYTDITLFLGKAFVIKATLKASTTELGGVTVVGSKSSEYGTEKTGAAVNITNQTINNVPTISRGLRDLTKLSPLANISGSGTSFAGANNRYNQFAIDGLVSNDVFGLAASGTNGGQTGIEPISLDAIEEFQINISPYDVRQGGFTGGGINAVTKSGTNTFHGSAYFFGNNQLLVSKNNPITGVKADYPDYQDFQGGFSVGGPIIKNKLFFFVNAEIDRRITPLAYAPDTTSTNVNLTEVNRVLDVLKRIAPSYDPGSFDEINNETNSNKFLVKLNYNISKNHKLSLRHSYTFGENIDNSRSAKALRFYNNGQYFPSTTNATGLELNSMFSNKYSNRLLVGYTRVRDDRDPLGSPFPTVLVNLGNSKTITLGSEYSSVANELRQDNISFTDDFNFYLGKHTITVGTHNELYKFYNIFVQNIYGNYAYKSLANFESIGTLNEIAPSYYAKSYSYDKTDDPSQNKGAADFSAMQLGLFGQDEFRVTKNILFTAGVRLDLPLFPDAPLNNAKFDSTYASRGFSTGTMPKTRVMISPRLGFNWDVVGNQSLIVRGGTGLFTGRVPFVWVSNQFTNNGQVIGTYSVGSTQSSANPITNPAGLKFNVDPYAQPFAEDLGKKSGRGAINVIDENFKFPQVFRTNLAVDKKLPWGILASLEGIFSKTYNNINFENINRIADTSFTFEGKDQRPRYSKGDPSKLKSGYNSAARIDANYDEIIYLKNTNEGYSYNVILSLQKQFENGFNALVSYTYGHSYDLNSGTSSVAYSNWRFVNQVDGLNDLKLSKSNFDLGSRVTALLSYSIEYMNKNMSTQVSLFYNGQSGQPLSYIYDGDLNNDAASNDLIYIPTDISEINLVPYTPAGSTTAVTAEMQWEALNAFIEGDKYLSKHRGEYAERNGARIPFQHNFDLRIQQEFKFKTGNMGNKIQVSLDFMNLGNLLNKEWGRQYYATNLQNTIIAYKGLEDTDPSNAFNFTNKPTFNYTGGSLVNGTAYSISDLSSRWRAQLGIRYIF